MKKVLIVTDELPPLLGGAGIVANELRRYIDNLEGYEVDIFCSQPSIRFFKRVYSLMWPFWYLSPSLYSKLKSSDIVIINDVRSAYFVGLVSKYLNGDIVKKCRYILHGTEYLVVKRSTLLKRTINFLRTYEYFLRNCESVTAVSKFTRDMFKSEFEWIDNLKLRYHYVGVPDDFIRKNPITVAKSSDKFTLVSVSRIEPRKGYIKMFKVFDRLINEHFNLEWYVYGSGSDEYELKRMVKNAGLGHCIHFMGAMPRELIFSKEMEKYNFDLFWLLPIEPEAFGLVYLEAAASGLAVMGPNNWGIKEAISSEFGYYYTDDFDWNSLFNSFLDADYKKMIALGAIEFAEKIKLSHFVKHILNE